jgi:hypothetical protein
MGKSALECVQEKSLAVVNIRVMAVLGPRRGAMQLRISNKSLSFGQGTRKPFR